MGPLLFILRRILINTLKELRMKPALLVAYGLLIAIFIVSMVVTWLSPLPPKVKAAPELYEILVTVTLLGTVYLGVRKGLSKGGSFFRLSDVALIFTSPISPKRVLLYGFIKQFFRTFITLAFLYFQIPNLKNHFQIAGAELFLVYVTIFTLVLSMEFVGFFVYTLTSGSQKWRNLVNKALDGAGLLLVLLLLIELFRTDNLLIAAERLLIQPWLGYVPFIGWYHNILMGGVDGFTPSVYYSALLLSAMYAAMLFILYKWKTDYYEEVLEATEHKEELYKARKEGKGNAQQPNLFKPRTVKKFRWRSGARAILSRHLLEYRKSGFLFINTYTLFLAAMGIAAKYIPILSDMKPLLYVSVYILFFTVLQGKWARELEKPYIYMLPASSASKLFFATLAEVMKCAFNGLILFTAAGIMFQASWLEILLCIVAYATFGAIFIYGDVLSRKLFGRAHSQQLRVFFKLFLVLFIITPGVVASAIMQYHISEGSINYGWAFYLILIGYNGFVSGVILIISKGIFEKLEMK
jgi:hypothetical protein